MSVVRFARLKKRHVRSRTGKRGQGAEREEDCYCFHPGGRAMEWYWMQCYLVDDDLEEGNGVRSRQTK
jgi:hypothetical protein